MPFMYLENQQEVCCQLAQMDHSAHALKALKKRKRENLIPRYVLNEQLSKE